MITTWDEAFSERESAMDEITSPEMFERALRSLVRENRVEREIDQFITVND